MNKHLITSLIVGFLGGIAGSLIFQPISNLFDIFLSDFTIGGTLIGGIMGYKKFTAFALKKKLLYGVIVGLIVFAVFGMISGKFIDDLIAGVFIGLAVGLISHYLGKKVGEKVEDLLDKDEKTAQ